MSNLALNLKLKADGSGLVGEVKRSKASIKGLNNELNKTATPSQNASRAYKQVAKSADIIDISSKRAAKSSKNMGRYFQNAGYQIQDASVMIAGGSNKLLVVAQQLPQFLGMFGAIGSLAGAAIAITASVGASLLPTLLDSENASEKLADSMERLEDTMERTGNGSLILTERIAKLAKTNAQAAKLQIGIAVMEADAAVKSAGSAINELATDKFESFFGAGMDSAVKALRKVENESDRTGESLSRIVNKSEWASSFSGAGALYGMMSDIQKEFGGTNAQAINLISTLNRVKTDGSVKSFENLQNALTAIYETTGGSKKEALQKFSRDLTTLMNSGKDAAEKTKELQAALSDLNGELKKDKTAKDEEGLVSKRLSASDRYLASLKQNIALFGKTSNAAQARYELEHGNLQGVDDKLAATIIKQASYLDGLKKQADAEKEITKQREEANKKREAEQEKARQTQNASFDRVASSLQTPTQKEDDLHQGNISTLDNQELGLGEYEYAERIRINQLIELEQQRHKDVLTQIDKTAAEKERDQLDQTLSLTGDALGMGISMMKAAGKEESALSKAMFIAQQAVAIPAAITATETGAAQALKTGGPYAAIQSGLIKALGYASVGVIAGQSIAGMAHDGIGRVPAANEGTWLLRKDEMVLNPTQRENFEFLTDNMKKGGGTSSAMPNVVVNLHQAAEGTVVEQRLQDNQLIIEIIQQAKDAAVDEVGNQVESREGRIGRAIAS